MTIETAGCLLRRGRVLYCRYVSVMSSVWLAALGLPARLKAGNTFVAGDTSLLRRELARTAHGGVYRGLALY